MSASDAVGESSADLKTIMAHAGARCFLGGDPHLVAVSRTSGTHPDPTTRNRGGEDTTFTPVDPRGQWKLYSNTPNAAVTAGRHSSYGDEKYLFPLYRGFNTNTKGVIYASGTIGISGVVRGVITLYSPKTIVHSRRPPVCERPGEASASTFLGTISGA